MDLQLWPKQGMAFQTEATELLFGGSAGPGKSHLLRVAAIAFSADIPNLQTYLFRRTHPDLIKNHLTGPTGLPALLSEWTSRKIVRFNYGKNYVDFWNGARIYWCHCQYEKDVEMYQGAEIHLLLMDELTHFTEPMYRFLRGRVRLGGMELPQRHQGRFPRIVNGANPGGIGHNWVKNTFIDSAPAYEIKRTVKGEGGMLRQFIPALLSDNPTMLKNDPEYADRLSGLGNEQLVKAMLEGDWDIVAGGMFDDLWKRERHVIAPFQIPHSWRVDRSFDWGSSKPFSVGWWAESDGTTAPNGITYPRGSLFRIAEWYGCARKPDGSLTPNEGLKMLAVDVAKGIVQRESSDAALIAHTVKPGPADSQIFDTQNGVCIAEDMRKHGVGWVLADKTPGSRRNGWERMRKYLKAARDRTEDPGLYIFNTCTDWIRTVPVLPRDPRNTDDVDTNAEDHQGDETRYRLLRRAMTSGISEDAVNALTGRD